MAGFYLYGVVSVLVGGFTVALLNMATPLVFFKDIWAFWLGVGPEQVLEVSWRFLLVVAFLTGVPVLAVRLLGRPVALHIRYLKAGLEPPRGLGEKGRRRLINLPSYLALALIFMWGIAPDLAAWLIHVLGYVDLRTGFSISGRASMVALISSGVFFFLAERYSRQRLIPLFFPQGRLAETKGSIRFSIAHRVHLSYVVGTLIPLLILIMTLEMLSWEPGLSRISGRDFARELQIFVVALAGIFIIGAFRLNHLVAKSILAPLTDMLEVVEKIKKGDYETRVRVVSNDEIGLLGDASNEMIQGLAERKRLRTEFGKYLTPQIRDEILSGRIPLNGEHREATLLFSDLRDFTPFVESHRADEVISGMRAYFTAMHRAIRKYDGLVLQFVGDEIEAVFGVPLACPDHPERAVLAALQMRRNLEELNRQRQKAGQPTFGHGIGIHTGTVLAGNSGSEEQLSYALIGSTVNVASRIQGLTKEFGCDILISKRTADLLPGKFALEEMPPRMVRGYSKEVLVCKLLG